MEFNFKLTDQEAQKMLNALITQPYGEVVDLINKIQKQASEQISVNETPSLGNVASPIVSNPFYSEPQEGSGHGV